MTQGAGIWRLKVYSYGRLTVESARIRGHTSGTSVTQGADIWRLKVYSYGRLTVEVIVQSISFALFTAR